MISIALCTYNGGKFLREQLNSIARQTLLPDELVICDDGSVDGTIDILKEFRDRVSFPVHIHQNEKNLGSTKNFEKAIGLCQGDIIALCDQDDVWKPEKLKRLGEALQTNPKAGYVFSDAEVVDDNLVPLGHSLWRLLGFEGKIRRLFLRGEQFPCLIRKDIVTGATMAFRDSVARLCIPFPAAEGWVHDAWIAIAASAVGSSGISIDETLIFYRQHLSQQIGVSDSPQRRSLSIMYHELKDHRQFLFAAWEERCLRILCLKDYLQRLLEVPDAEVCSQNLLSLREFETHFLARKKILTSKGLGRYRLIFKEALSGRYALFSDSWKSIARDLFL
jgi:glycosyltransferase involved in cell wall biosynthesis